MRGRRPTKSSPSAAGSPPAHGNGRLGLIALEKRIAFDAALVDTGIRVAEQANAAEPTPEPAHAPLHDTADVSSAAAIADLASTAQTSGSAAQGGSIIFVDSHVDDIPSLLRGLNNPGAEIVLLDSSRDGVEQIASALAGRSGLSAIHIISHGDSGRLQLGNTELTQATMTSRYGSEMAIIRNALGADADILLYGCDVAAGEAGAAFIRDLASLTGADIAASEDITGSVDFGGDWDLEANVGEIDRTALYGTYSFRDWHGALTLAVTTGTTAAQTVDAFTMGSGSGITTSAQALNNTTAAWYGTFTTTASNLGLSDGAVLSTGLAANLPGNPATAPNASSATTGISSGSERDIGTLTFSFQVATGVTKIAAVYVMGSEEYPEYTGQGFSDNVTITLNGGAYTNTNIALVPGTSTGVDIDTINATTNSQFYRGATTGAPTNYALTDIVLDGFTTVLSNVRTVAAATTYTVTIKVADFTDNQYDSAVFINYFGSSLRLDLDSNNSTATNANFAATYTENGASIAIVDTDAALTNYDSGTDPVSATIRLTNAQAGDVLTVGSLPAGITSSIDTSVAGVITVQLSGSSSEANYLTALNAIRFSNTSDAPSTTSRNITFSLSDGATISNTATTTLTVVSVNDAPVNTLPASYATNEDIALQLTGLSVTDVDAASGTMTVTLGVTAGTLTATTGGGVTISGSGTASLTLSGTLASINSYLAGGSAPTYVPVANASGAITLTMTTSDNGNTGTGGTLTDIDTRTITVTAVNDAPVNTLPASFTTNEEVSLSLAGLSISDVDAGSSAVTVTLSVNAGTLTATTGGSVTVSGSGTGSLTLSGTVANINAYLAVVGTRPVFVPAANGTGAVTLTMVTNDGGNTGTGGAQSDTDVATITINAINDAPVNTLPASYATNEDIPLQLTGLSVTDVDAASGTMTVTLGVTAGTLTATTGGGVTISGSGTASLTLSGTLASINAYLAGSSAPTYIPVANASGTITLTMTTSDNGNTGTGGTLTDIDTRTITVTAVNDAPVNTVPGAQSTNEDVNLVFQSANGNAITVSDVETTTLTVTLWAEHGLLTLATTAGLSFLGGDGTADYEMQFSGTASAINTALNGLIFAPTTNNSGAGTLYIATSDGSLRTLNSVAIDFLPVVDAVTDAVSVVEDGSVTFNPATNDSFGSGGTVSSVSTPANGTAVLNADRTVTYTPGNNFAGSDTFTYTTKTVDPGFQYKYWNVTPPDGNSFATVFPSGFPATASDGTGWTRSIGTADVLSIGREQNDTDGTLVAEWSGAFLVRTAGTYTFQITADNIARLIIDGVTIGDVGWGNGTLTFNATLTAGDHVFQLQYADVLTNEGVTVTYSGADTSNAAVNISSAQLWGSAIRTETGTVNVTVTPVNDAPVNTLPATYTTNEDTSLQLTGLSVTDVDAAAGTMTVTLGVTAGTLTATTGGGVTIAGSGTASLTLSGTLASINSYLAGGSAPTYVPVANASGAITLTMTTSDNGNTGTGGTLTDIDTRTITVTAVNDAPVNTLPASFAATEDTSLSLAGLSISDVDAGSSAVTVTLSVTAGTLTATTGGSVTVSGSGTGSLTLSGTVANINAYLAAVGTRPVFVPAANGTGAVTLTMVTDDGGNTGTGGALTDTDVGTITIAAVNDAPVNTLPASFSTNEDTSLSLAGLSISDDAGASAVTVTLSVNAGTLTATTGGGVTISGSGTTSLTLSGTVADINAYLAAVGTRPVFVPVANTSGSVTLTMVTNDGGNTGTGGILTDTDVATITIVAVNDAPVNTLPASFSTNEDSALQLTGLSVTDVDAAAGTMTVTLGVTAGTLTATTGGGVTIAGSGTASLTLSGTLASINSYLAGGSAPTYVPVANASGAITLTMTTSDNGNTGTGGTLTDIDTRTITVTAVNDAPVNTLPASFAATEDTSLSLAGLSITDIDAGSSAVTVTLSVTAGTLTATTGGSVTVSGSGTGSLTLSGTVASINSYLAGGSAPTYVPVANASGAITLTMTTSDNGNTGTGGTLTDIDTRTITVTAVNDAPVNTLPASFAATEDTSLSLAGLSISDVDAGSSAVTVTLSVTAGTLTATTGGSVTVSGSGTGSLTLSGTVANINAYLAAVGTRPVFVPAANGTGAVTLTMVTDDGGNTGTGGALTDTDVGTITIAAVNDAPVNTLPASFSTNEDTSLSLAGLSISDDAGASAVTVTLSVNAGTLTATTGGGVTISGSGTTSLTLSGTVADINAYLAAVGTRPVFVPVANTSGSVTLTMVTNDGGNTGTGGILTDTDVATITIVAVNDAPVNTLPASFSTNEDSALQLTGLSVTDVDAAAGTMTVTLGVTAGTLTATTGGGVTIAGSGTASLTLSGTLASINSYLAGGSAPTYVPVANASGAITLTMTTSDNGNTGTGGTLTDIDTRTITVTAVNDAPVNTLPASFAATEDTSLSLAGLSITDIDAGSSAVTVTLSVTAGTLTATTGGSVTVSGSGTGSLTLAGSLADLNAYLASAAAPSFVPVANMNGAVTLTMVTNDGGNSGSGGPLTDTDIATITIAPVNDAPVNTIPAGFSTNEDTALQLTGLAISDGDAGSAPLSVTLSVTSGTLTASSGAGVTVTGSGTGSLTLAGSLADLNAYLASAAAPTYVPVANMNGAVTLTMVTSDNGNSGAGGILTDTDIATITVTPVNDAPVGANDSASATEDGAASGNLLSNDSDVDGDPLTVTGFAWNGSAYAPGALASIPGVGTLTIAANGSFSFTPAADYAGPVPAASYTLSDGTASANAALTLAVIAVNDAPVNTIPASFSTNEDTALQLTGLAITDVDAGSGAMTVTLSVTAGTLTATTGSGVTVTGSGTGSLTLAGSLADLNAYLASAAAPSFVPVANMNGAVTLTMVTNDGGNSGSGGPLTDTDIATITIAPVNDAPVNTIPAGFSTNEDTALQLTGLAISDGDAGSAPLSVTLSVTSGTLTASSGAGVTVTGSGTGSLTLAGSLADLNAYLASAAAPTYVPVANMNGAVTLTMVTSDNGNSGAGGILTDTDIATITVTPVNDAPVGANDSASATEDGAASGNLLSNDSDVDGDPLTVTGFAWNGSAYAPGALASIPGVGTLTIAANGSFSFTPAADYAGPVPAASYTLSDGTASANAALTLAVIAVNDAPVNTIPASFSTNEDTALQLTGLAITDVDAGSGAMTVTLSVTAGTLTATTGSGVTVTGSGTGSLTLAGSLADLNAYLASAAAPSFVPVANMNGAVTLTMVTNDGGNSGSGGPLTDTDIATITIAPVNDAPVNTIPAGFSTNEDTALQLTGLAISDGDAGSAPLSVTLSVTSGTLTASSGAGVTVTGSGTGSLTLAGSLADLNAYLASAAAPTYVPVANMNGAVTLTMVTSDNGNSGAGGILTDTDIATITVTPVNDAPVGANDSASATEDGAASGNLLSNDSDVDGDPLTVTGFAWNGSAYAPGALASIPGVGTLTIAANGSFSFTPAADYAGPVPAASYTLSDGTASANAALTLAVIAVNDAPVNTIPASFSTNEDTALQLTGLAITDVDAGSGAMTVTLSVTAGTLTATTGSGVTVTGSGTGSLTLAGSLADLNAYLASAAAPSFVPVANMNGAVTLTMVTNDGGNSGSGGPLTDTDIATITIAPVNDAPVNTIPAGFSTNEDTALQLTGLAISDGDAGSAPLSVTLSVTSGTLTASSGAGVTVTGSGTGSLTLAGSLADLNAYLASAAAPTYVPVANMNGAVTLTMVTSDNGNSGAGGILTDTDIATITVTPVNDAPVGANDSASATEDGAASGNLLSNDSDVDGDPLTVTGFAWNGSAYAPGALASIPGVGTLTIAANGSFSFTPAADYAGPVPAASYTLSDGTASANAALTLAVIAVNDAPVNTIPASFSTNEDTALQLTGLAITDVDAGSGAMTVTLSVTAGTLTATTGSGVTVTGSGTGSLTLAGSLADLNAYLASAAAPSFVPVANMNGAVTLTMVTNDGGNSGSGGPLTDTDIATITIAPVNDAPVNTIPAGFSTNEDTALQLTGLAISDGDAGSAPLSVTLSVTSGTLTASSGAGVTVTGSGTGSLTLAGSLADLNAYLASAAAPTYVPVANMNGAVTLTMVTSDNGNSGAGGILTDTDIATITVTPVNDAPVGANDSASATEDGAASGNLLSNDSDVDGDPLTVTGFAWNGSAYAPGALASIPGVGTLTIAANGSFSFTPAADYAGPVPAASYTLSDGTASANAALTLAVIAVNDAPVNTIPASFSTNEDTALQLTGLAITDVDAGSGAMTVTLSVTAGTLTATTGSGVTVTGSGTGSLTLAGSLADLNAYLASAAAPSFVPVANMNGAVTLTMVTNDGGNSGSGGPLTDTDIATITIAPVNDAPVNTIPAGFSTNEDTALQLTGLAISDGDAGSAPLSVTLSVTSGTLTASSGAGVTVTGSGTGSLTLAGSLADLNAYLASAAAPTYVPVANMNGAVTLTMVTSDNGNSGAGGILTDTDIATITVTPVNDAPVGANDSASATEDGAASGNLLSNDSDVDGDPLTVTGFAWNGSAYAPGALASIPGVGTLTIAANGSFSFTPAADYAGPVPAASYTLSDGTASANAALTLAVIAVNDAPVNTIPASFSTNEDTALQLTGLAITDVDAGSGAMTVTLSVTAGTLTATTGSGVTVTGSGTGSLTLAGSLADLNAYLASAAAPSFVPVANMNGAVTLTMVTNDGGNSGSGGPLTDTDIATITIAPVNDAPVNTIPAGFSTNEDTALQLTGLAISDGDAGSAPLSVTLSVTSGTLTASSGAGVTVTGSGTGSLTLAGSLADLNAYLASAAAPTYVPVANMNGAVTLTMVTSDNGNSGAGGILTDTDIATITVTPVNDAPVGANDSASATEDGAASGNLLSNDSDVDGDPLTVTGFAWNGSAYAPGALASIPGVGTLTIAANGSFSFTPAADYAGPVPAASYTLSDGTASANAALTLAVIAVNDAPVNTIPASFSTNEDTALQLTGLAITDVDAGSGAMTVTLSVTAGTLTATTGSGVTVTGSGTGSLTLAGSLADLNAYLASAAAPSFVPVANMNGAVTLTMVTNDGGNSGSGGPLTDTDIATITIAPVNDAPVNTIPAGFSTNEDTALQLTGLAISDGDAGSAPLSVTLSVTSGTLTASSGAGVTVTGSGTGSLTLAGSLADLNAYLASAAAPTYVPVANMNGAVTLTMVTSDNGNSGAGGILTDTDIATITVTPVNDAPVGANDSASATEDGAASGNLLSNDSDVDGDPLTVTGFAWNGSAYAPGALASIPGVGTLTIAANGSFSFTPAADYAGPVPAASYTLSDGTASANAALTLAVIAVNDAPVNTIPASFSTNEDTALQLTGLAITDVDAGSGAMTVTLSVTAGTLTATTGSGVTVTGSGTGSLTLAGSLADLNAYLASAAAPSFVPVANMNGAVTLTMVTNDGGNSGSGGPLTDTDIATITIAPVNDAPVNTIPAGFSTNEDTALQLTGLAISDGDAGSAPLSVTLSVTSGTLTASSGAGVTVTGSGTGSLTLAGSLADLNAYLASAAAPTYVPVANMNGAVTLTMVTSDNGNSGAGGILTDTDIATITVTPVNDAPVGANDSASATEDGAASGNLLSNDSDVDGDPLTVTGFAWNGSAYAPGALASIPGVGTLTIAANGSFSFTPAADYAGPVPAASYTLSDGTASANAALTLAVIAVNDAPVNTIPASFSTNEDTALQLTGLAITDVDAGSGAMTVTLSVTAGTLTATTGSGVTVTGSGTGSLTLAGSLADLNAYLASAAAPSFVPVANMNGAVTLTMVTNDGGNSGSGGPLTDTDIATITIAPVNDAPVNTIPAGFSTNEDTALQLTGLAISDGDAGSAPLSVTLSVTSGTLTASSGAGVTVTGSGTGSLTLAGSLADLNAYLASAAAPTYVPVANMNGAVTLTMVTSDNGNSGAGGILTDTDIATITVTPVNDAPVGANDSASATEDGAASGNLLSNDSDVDGDPLTVTGFAWNGSAYAPGALASIPGVGTLTIAANGSFSFTPAADYAGPVPAASYTLSDGTASANAALTLAVIAVNDAPVNTIPASFSTNEDTALQLTGLAITDVDAGSGAMTVTLSVTAGTLTATTGSGVTVTGSGTGSLTLAGSLADLNAYLASAAAPSFVPVANMNGAVTLTMVTNDGGNSGSGGILTDTDIATITIAPVNDAPVNTIPAAEIPFISPAAPSDQTRLEQAREVIESTGRESALPRTASEGIIIETVNRISALDGGTASVNTDRPLLTAVNGMARLDSGIELAASQGRILDPVKLQLPEPGSQLQDLGPSTFQLRELLGLAPFPAIAIGNDRLSVVGRLDGSTLVIRLDELTRNGNQYRLDASRLVVTMSDGTPIPSWLSWNTKGQLLGQPPAGTADLPIHVRGILTDGSPVDAYYLIDSVNGEVRSIEVPTRKSSDRPALFSEELGQSLRTNPDSITLETPQSFNLRRLLR